MHIPKAIVLIVPGFVGMHRPMEKEIFYRMLESAEYGIGKQFPGIE